MSNTPDLLRRAADMCDELAIGERELAFMGQWALLCIAMATTSAARQADNAAMIAKAMHR